MAELFTKLGIDWRLLAANTLTFFLVLWVLRKFAYRPILNVLERRQAQVAEGMAAAKQSQTELAAIQQQKQEILRAAKLEGAALIAAAREQAEAAKTKIAAEAQDEATATLQRAKAQLQRERETMIASAKTELADVIVAATAKVLDQHLDEAAQATMTKSAVKALQEVAQ